MLAVWAARHASESEKPEGVAAKEEILMCMFVCLCAMAAFDGSCYG